MDWLDWLFVFASGLVCLPVLVLFLETLASLLPLPRSPAFSGKRPSIVVLVPAHNEEVGIAETVRHLSGHFREGDRLLVVADNCTDATATLARECGAEVIERRDPVLRGKGYALDRGLQELANSPPEVVIVVDADCRLSPGSLDALAEDAIRYRVPIQAIYLPGAGGDSARQAWSAFAVKFKNEVRPRGLHRLGQPVLLTGSGMAFAWSVMRSIEWGTGNIVEDMKLGLDLAIAGSPPRLCPAARVSSEAPPNDIAAMKQRTRWEHGHVRTLLTEVPRLLIAGMVQFRPRIWILALELAVPPLSLLVLAKILVFLMNWAIWQYAGCSMVPMIVSGIGWATLILTILLAWGKYGRGIVPISSIVVLPLYVLWKLPIYLRLIGRREKEWIRTERGPQSEPKR